MVSTNICRVACKSLSRALLLRTFQSSTAGTVHRFQFGQCSRIRTVLASSLENRDNFFLSLREPTVLHSVRLGGQKQEAMAGHHDCSSSGLDKGLGAKSKR